MKVVTLQEYCAPSILTRQRTRQEQVVAGLIEGGLWLPRHRSALPEKRPLVSRPRLGKEMRNVAGT